MTTTSRTFTTTGKQMIEIRKARPKRLVLIRIIREPADGSEDKLHIVLSKRHVIRFHSS